MGELLVALLAGVGAGFMNAAVGAGTLVTFPPAAAAAAAAATAAAESLFSVYWL